MRHNTLAAQIKRFLSAHPSEWHNKGKLTAEMVWKYQTGQKYGARYMPETVGRTLRSLEEDKFIAVKDDGKTVQYRWIPENWRAKYIPYSRRPDYLKTKLFV